MGEGKNRQCFVHVVNRPVTLSHKQTVGQAYM